MDARLPDDFYKHVKDLLPAQPTPGPQGGRPPTDHFTVLKVIWFVLTVGCCDMTGKMLGFGKNFLTCCSPNRGEPTNSRTRLSSLILLKYELLVAEFAAVRAQLTAERNG
ncbi:hypothetical protein KOR42_46370 [Thalassoglobus neptunius]|uniref:Uncharacterized protein n=1 Tax=Thalassoglobus neptunius TaxID=1938619 RepID=A0A5C5VZ94_9PLAN|nr:hypothetical protein [Thalassoglobus neptunius]TWT42782.1 hypothetical protein KOR42_46370 [Thalassoglobus neptunius]